MASRGRASGRGRGRGRATPSGAAAPAAARAAAPAPVPDADDADVEVDEHPIGIILCSQTSVARIRFSMSREHWVGKPAYAGLPAVVQGELQAWVNRSEHKISVQWLSDDTNSTEWLSRLLRPSLSFKLLPYENGNSAPKAKGMASKRAYAQAVKDGPYAARTAEDEARETVSVNYKDLGGLESVQIWDVRGPQFVKTDFRTEERFPATLNVPSAKTNSLPKMLFNVGLDLPFARQCVTWFNERLPTSEQCSEGEVVQMWGCLVAIALNSSFSVGEAWRRKPMPGDLYPPPALGNHGLNKNRFKDLMILQGQMFSVDESELDADDPWRYSRPPVASYNQRRKSLINPSWLLLLDELMSMWLGAEGVLPGKGANFKPIPFLSHVERKPEPLGCEVKVAADGVTGCFLNLELQEGAEAHQNQAYYAEYGHTTAVSLRLLEPWFSGPRRPAEPWFKGPNQPQRAVYGDGWFAGVNWAESLYWESGKALFPFGDVKTNSSRFAVEELRRACGPDSGDWDARLLSCTRCSSAAHWLWTSALAAVVIELVEPPPERLTRYLRTAHRAVSPYSCGVLSGIPHR